MTTVSRVPVPLWNRVARLVSVAILSAVAALVAAGAPASAHAELAGSNPVQGSTVASLPGSVRLTFSEVVGRPAAVSVIAPDGTDLADGGPGVVDDTLTQPVAAADAPAGQYSVSYQVMSADGHTISGAVQFVLQGVSGQASETAGASPAPSADEGVGTGVLVGLVAGLVAALGMVVLGLSRLVGGSRDG